MDFQLTEGQTTVRELAEGLFARHGDPQHLAEIEAGDERFDRRLWQDLADSGVLGLVVPAEHDGAGLGLSEFGLALIEQGRRVPLVPLWETVVLGALPLIRYGTEKQQNTWLPRIAEGGAVLTAALESLGTGRPLTTAGRAGGTDGANSTDGWEISGTCTSVPFGHLADAAIVPASTQSGAVELFLVETDQPGVARSGYERTDRGRSADLTLASAYAQRLGTDDPSEDPVSWLLQRAWIGLAALQLGVSQESVRQTADYLSHRHQFGVPLATFQAAAHQAANCHIDTEAMEVTFWNALWRQETDRPAVAAAHTAKWWAADAGDRVARTVQHLHGGLGADVTYPIHRYMLWSSQLANTLGSASWHLHQIGTQIAGGTA
ncbi:acyl-CoA dehydrogenase family protein [Micromonospora sp. NBC_01412]|uniref:acyl-CoA dehydrogenase family protein n=1 Tax=Micromonospora sp. NBC_01412 TaxID=2903590 RepID=UPI0032529963